MCPSTTLCFFTLRIAAAFCIALPASSPSQCCCKNASIIYLDNPAGVGFSTIPPGHQAQHSDAGGAPDFQQFLLVLFRDIFPSLADHPIHIAGEPYGGHYVPVYTHHILRSRKYNSAVAFRGNIESIILVNAMIDEAAPSIGEYDLLCAGQNPGILNSTACDAIEKYLPECRKLTNFCYVTDGKEVCAEEVQGRRRPYNVNLPCDEYPLCFDPKLGNFALFLNQAWVKTRLGFSPYFDFHGVNLTLNSDYFNHGDVARTARRELISILDDARTDGCAEFPDNSSSSPGIRVLVMNGNDDFIQASWRATPWTTWPPGKTAKTGIAINQYYHEGDGFWKQSHDGQLVFVGINGAGHAAPGDNPEVASAVLAKWLNGWEAQD
ncbi:hypothetical protein MKZ38_006173 [Zalerion maritima]|uniref:carboxypeptidase C n=1 Tax=Zalerion maritima TaxID=339359 RepID=A0AAD5RKG3_9PEZI|nr:hypothetical protein MKZ38_006173 [Zalerion maritima]